MSEAARVSMVAAGADTKILEHPLIADDITQLIGKVRTSVIIGEKRSLIVSARLFFSALVWLRM